MTSRNRLPADNIREGRSGPRRILSAIKRVWEALEVLDMFASGVFWVVLALLASVGGIFYLFRKVYERSTRTSRN